MLSPLHSLVAVFSVSTAGSKKEMLRGEEGRRRNGAEEVMCESSEGKAEPPTEVGVRCAER